LKGNRLGDHLSSVCFSFFHSHIKIHKYIEIRFMVLLWSFIQMGWYQKYGSVIECLPSICKALGLISSGEKYGIVMCIFFS
jgi:hypothetical protein